MKINFLKTSYLLLASLVLGSFSACSPDEADGNGNGLGDPNVDAAFTVTAIDGQPNKFMLQATGANVIGNKWSTGGAASNGSDTKEIFLPDAGTYTVTHTAIGRGGLTNTATQTVTVATPDPIAGNLILGGKFQNADDYSKWTVLNISSSGAAWTFHDGYASISANGYNQQGIYQAVSVVGGKPYKIDMRAFSTTGVGNTWFEVYASKTAPTQNNDYSADGIRMQLNTWAGCGGSPFDGQLSSIGCGGSGGTVTFADSGIAYIVIKCGGENATGISITDVEMRRIE